MNGPDKLSEIAAIFGEFDGELFDREAFEERLLRISPRSSYLTGRGERTDTSKFRDEISAYPAYLGLYFLEQSSSGWVVRVSDTAKKFLLREEPRRSLVPASATASIPVPERNGRSI